MRKIFTDFPICGTFELSADDAHHVVVVLRHTVGDTLNVTDCTGATYECFITRMEGHSAYLTPARKISDGPSSNGRAPQGRQVRLGRPEGDGTRCRADRSCTNGALCSKIR